MDVQICQRNLSESFSKVFLMSTFFVAVVFVTVTFTFISTFYPIDAAQKGLSPTETGLVFAVFQVGVIVLGPVVNYVNTKVGLRFVYLWSLFVCMAATFLFGLTKYISSVVNFLFVSIAVRILQGVTYFGVQSTAITMATDLYPEDVSKAVGLIEVANGIGFSAGPPIGGGLYQFGGYITPFICVPTVCLFILLWSIIFTKERSNHKEVYEVNTEKPNLLKVFLIPQIYVGIFNVAIYSVTYLFLDLSLSAYMTRRFKIKEYQVGFVFMGECLAYGFSGPLVGYLADKTKRTTEFMCIGCIMNALAYFFMGPSAEFGIESTLVLFIVCVHAVGFASSFTFIPTMQFFVQSLEANGYVMDLPTKGLLSTILTLGSAVGGLIGPIIGGAILEFYSFEAACFVFAAMNIGMLGLHVADLIYTRWSFAFEKKKFVKLRPKGLTYGLISK